MRKLLFAILFTFLLPGAKAQTPVVFCPAGAEWHDLFAVYMSGTFFNKQIKYVRDSIVDSVNVKVLYHDNCYNYYNMNYCHETVIKQTGDTVFFRNLTTLHTWQVLYNFAATTGQSWTNTITATGGTPTASVIYTVTVDSVKNVTINNFVLRRLFVTYDHPNFHFVSPHAAITERFGSDHFMFSYQNPWGATDADEIVSPICYQDDSFGAIQFTDKFCDFGNPLGVQDLKFKIQRLELYPNPVKDKLELTGMEAEGMSFTIQNPLGQTVYEQKITAEKQQIDVSGLNNGVYFLKVSDGAGQKVFKVVKD